MGNLHIPCKKKSPEVFVSYAICTDEKCRGKGYGASITNFASDYVTNYNNKINKSSSDSSDDCDAISILSPASKSLVNFYKPLGYEPFFFCHNQNEKFPIALNPCFCHLFLLESDILKKRMVHIVEIIFQMKSFKG